MMAFAQFFDWREALVVVKPATFMQRHRAAFRTFWRWKSRKRGRAPLPKNLCEVIWRIARENPTWGEGRIADELNLKLGIKLSPRTIRKYLSTDHPRGTSDERWSTFVRNYATAMVACDFFTAVTVNFRILYVFVRCDRDRLAPNSALPCNRASYGRMDGPAVLRIPGVRSPVPFLDPRPGQHLRPRRR
jgi:hypothetical protein